MKSVFLLGLFLGLISTTTHGLGLRSLLKAGDGEEHQLTCDEITEGLCDLEETDGWLEVKGYKLHYFVYAKKGLKSAHTDALPALVGLHGGPGGNHFELYTLKQQACAADRKVILYDQMGAGDSDRPTQQDAPWLWTMDYYTRHKLMTIEELLEQDSSAPTAPPTAHSSAGAAKTPLGAAAAGGVDKGPLPQRSGRVSVPVATTSSVAAGAAPRGQEEPNDSEDTTDFRSALQAIRGAPKPGAAVASSSDDAAVEADAPRKPKKAGWDAPSAAEEEQNAFKPAAAPDASPPRAVRAQLPEGTGKLRGQVAVDLLTLLLGSGRRLPDSFTHQGFAFNPAVPYGLVQLAGGPCGVLAAVQAFLLRDLFFPADAARAVSTSDLPQLSRDRFFEALRCALCHILAMIATSAQTRGGHHVKLVSVSASAAAVPSDLSPTFFTSVSGNVKWLSHLEVTDVPATRLMQTFSNSLLSDWCEEKGTGLLCFVLSCVLTRGMTEVAADMDMPTSLIVEHGYCSQELTNLCICGRAWSNVHDGETSVGSMVMRGFHGPLDVGFLSMMEHRGHLICGDHAKKPRTPIWIIFNESHYTVLFARSSRDVRDVLKSQFVDVWYYDQQGGQTEEIRLTLKNDGTPLPLRRKEQPRPYLDDIIRTVSEWATVKVDWNGTDPLL